MVKGSLLHHQQPHVSSHSGCLYRSASLYWCIYSVARRFGYFIVSKRMQSQDLGCWFESIQVHEHACSVLKRAFGFWKKIWLQKLKWYLPITRCSSIGYLLDFYDWCFQNKGSSIQNRRVSDSLAYLNVTLLKSLIGKFSE